MADAKRFLWVMIDEIVDGTSRDESSTTANVTIGDHKWSLSLLDPLRRGPEDAERLDWYFEQRYRIPEAEHMRAKVAERNIAEYGANLFAQIFSGPSCPIELQEDEQKTLAFQITGDNVHKLLWETIRASVSHEPFATTTAVIRHSLATGVRQDPIVRQSARKTINVLLVLSRPYLESDIASDIISRPLYEILSTAALGQYYKLDMVRPGSFKAVKDHLQKAKQLHGKGFYDVIHFDLHGIVMTYNQLRDRFPHAKTDTAVIDAEVLPIDGQMIDTVGDEGYSGSRPFLLFSSSEEAEENVNPVDSGTVEQLLKEYEIPITVFNSCESSKEEAGSEASLARILSQGACEFVIGMSFSITATGATIFMKSLYQSIIFGVEISIAVSRARKALFSDRQRYSGAKTYQAEDWMLPVLFCSNSTSTASFPARHAISSEPGSMAPDDNEKKDSGEVGSRIPELPGRNLDILAIEEKLFRNDGTVLVNGTAGVGKSSLLQYLGWWWQCTNFITDHFMFDFRESTCSIDMIHSALRQRGMIADSNIGSPGSEERLLEIVESLSQGNYAVFIDSLERAAQVLSREETGALRKLLTKLTQSGTFVVLATQGIQQNNVLARAYERCMHHLGGLDNLGVDILVSRMINSLPLDRRPVNDKDLSKLVQQLDGNPLAIEVILSGLATKSVFELVMNLNAASTDLSQSLQTHYGRLHAPIETAFLALSEPRQVLLLCLAPLSLHLDRISVGKLGKVLKTHPILQNVAVEQLGNLIDHLNATGLIKLAAQHLGGRLMLMHPLLTTFLRERLSAMDRDFQEAVNVCCLQNFAREAEDLLVDRSSASSDDERYRISLIIDFQYEYLFGTLRAMVVEFHKSSRNITTLLCANFYRLEKMSECYNVASTVLNLYADIAGAEVAFRVDIVVAYYWACVSASSLNWLDEVELLFQRVKDFRHQVQAGVMGGVDASPRDTRDNKTMSLIYLELLVLMGSLALKSKDTSSSRQYFENAREIRAEIGPAHSYEDTSILLEYYQQGQLCMSDGRIEEADLLLSQAIAIYDENPTFVAFDNAWSSVMLLSDVKKQLGELQNAKDLYERALDMLPNDPSRLIKKTLVLVNMSSLEGLRGNHIETAELGRLALMSLNQYPVTQPTQQILEVSQYRATAYHNIGMSMANRGLIEEARSMFLDALKEKESGGLLAEMAVTYQALGSLSQNQGMFEEAAQDYKKAVEHASDVDGYVFRSLGYLMLDLDDPETARYFLERSLKAVPALTKVRSGDHLVTLATVEETLGNPMAAERYLEQALARQPSPEIPSDVAKWSETQIRLARLSLSRRDYSEAFTRYWKGLKALVVVPESQDFQSLSALSTVRLFDLTFFEQEKPDYRRILAALAAATVDFGELVLEHRPHRFHAVSTYNLARLLMECGEWRIAAILVCTATKMWDVGEVRERWTELINVWAAAKTNATELADDSADSTLCKQLSRQIRSHLLDSNDSTRLNEVQQNVNSILRDL